MAETPTSSIIVYSTKWCGDCRRTKRWLDANQIPYTAIDIDESEEAADLVVAINQGTRSVPTIVFPDGAVLTEPSNRQLALLVEQALGIATPDSARAHG